MFWTVLGSQNWLDGPFPGLRKVQLLGTDGGNKGRLDGVRDVFVGIVDGREALTDETKSFVIRSWVTQLHNDEITSCSHT